MGKLTFRRRKKAVPPPPLPAIHAAAAAAKAAALAMKSASVKKKASGARLWMRMDRLGQSEVMECDKSGIIRRVAVPARDLRILGPIFSHSSSILARERAMIVNLEFIRAIVTAEEVLLLEPLRQEVLPFVDQLRRQLPKTPSKQDAETQSPATGQWLRVPEASDGLQDELPFEFQVLEIALEVVCTDLDSSAAELEREAYPLLDEMARNVSTKNLEHVRGLKSNLTRLLARVQKVRDEIEHLLDDNDDMAQLYLTRKSQQIESMSLALASNSVISAAPRQLQLSSMRSNSVVSNYPNDSDVDELEMLLEAYFTQLDGTRNKILSVREYIDDTEDYVNIQLDNQRNELIQLKLTLTIAAFAIAVETLVSGIFGMNIPFTWNEGNGIFERVVFTIAASGILIFLLILGYARYKKLIG